MEKLEILEYLLMFLIAGGFLAWSFIGGLDPIGVTFDLFFIAGEIVTLNAVYITLGLSLFFIVTTILLTAEVYSRKEIPEISSGPDVAALIPTYQDAEVLENAVVSLNNSDYQDLDIYVVCEPGDNETIERAENLECEVIMNSRPGSKAEAINTAVESIDADYYAIFDADEIINPGFIPKGVGYMEQGFDAFQGRRIPITGGLPENFAYCERALYHAMYELMELTGFCFVKSSSTIVTEELLDKVGGYDDVITEDTDFTYKCNHADVSVKSDRRVTNRMESPHSFRDFWGQRKRWSMGFVQLMHKSLIGEYVSNKSFRGLRGTLRAVTGVFGPVLFLAFFAKLLLLFILGAEIIFLTSITVVALPALILSFKDRKEVEFIHVYSLLSFFTGITMAFMRIKSVFEYILSWDGEWFRIQKEGDLR